MTFFEGPIEINNTVVEPGQQELIKIPVGRIPSGNQISIRAFVFRSKNPGPVVLVLGGVHGDEVNGVEIVRRAINGGMFNDLQCGSVIAIPVLNIYGFINFSRDVPDGKDINRSFPGSQTGSLAARVARTLTKKIMPFVNIGLDFHTGGRGHYNFPQIRYTGGHSPSEQLARLFAPPYMIAIKPIAKSLRKYAIENGIPMLVYEGGENLRLDNYSTQQGISGLRRVLASQSMIAATEESGKSFHFGKTTWIRASRAGMFQTFKTAGNPVQKGEQLGYITDPYGQYQHLVVARKEGYIIGHSNLPVVSQGDALFHLAYDPLP